MSPTPITSAIWRDNRAVLTLFHHAHAEVSAARTALHDPAALRTRDRAKLDSHAAEGVRLLGDAMARLDELDQRGRLMIDQSASRQAQHAVRSLESAQKLSGIYAQHYSKGEARERLGTYLAEAETRARLGVESAFRSLGKPALTKHDHPSHDTTGGGSHDDRPVYDDSGRPLDGLGNPVRGSDGYVGPDDPGSDFPGRGYDGGYGGPDGSGSYSGI